VKKIRLDPVVVIFSYLFLLILCPSTYIFKPLGAAGTPATMFGCVMLVIWAIGRVMDVQTSRTITATHILIGLFALAMLVSFAAGMLRPISTAEAMSSARGLITIASGAGVVLFGADAIRDRGALDVALRAVAFAGFVLAVMGVIQFFTGINWITLLHWPGLTANSGFGGIGERSGFRRVNGTAVHAIEFSTVVGMITPIAIHLATNARRHRWWYWLQCIVLLGSLPLAVSRSGMIALAVALLFLVASATPRQRIVLLCAAPFALVGFQGMAPHLLGTLKSLFTGAGSDISIAGRTADYQAVGWYFGQSPWFGRGLGTFMPSLYRTLDNQYLGTLIEGGLLGLAAMCALFVGTIIATVVAVRRARDRAQRNQGYAIAVGILIGGLMAYTFDMFGFSMAFGMLQLLLGLTGAVTRVNRPASRRRAPTQPRPQVRPVVAAVSLAVAVAILAGGALATQRARPSYQAQVTMWLHVPQSADTNLLYRIDAIRGMSDVIVYTLRDPAIAGKLAAEGVTRYTISEEGGSLEPYTDRQGRGDLVTVAVDDGSPSEAMAKADVAAAEVDATLARLQNDPAIPPAQKVIADRKYAQPRVVEIATKPDYAFVAVFGASLLGGLLCAVTLSRAPSSRASRTRRRVGQRRTAPVSASA
jgi:O-antigen ligase